MRRAIKKIFVVGTTLTLLGGQLTFAADQIRNQTRKRVQDRTSIKDGSGSKTQTMNQNRNMKQNRNLNQNQKGSGKTLPSGK